MSIIRYCFILLFSVFLIPEHPALADSRGKTSIIRPLHQTIKKPSSSSFSMYPPNILGHSTNRGSNRGTLNSKLKITGRDFMPNAFQVRLSSIDNRGKKHSTKLTIISRSKTQIVARLPFKRISGKLIAGYGTPRSEVVVSQNFIVHGQPKITRITPRVFYKGARITISGRDLYDLSPLTTYYHDGISEKMIGFGSYQKLLVISNWKTQSRKAQFTIPLSCNPNCGYGATPTAGQYIPHIDAPLSGNLWIKSSSQKFDTSIHVSYLPENPDNTARLSIIKSEAPKWGNKPVSFVYGGSFMNRISINGAGFKGSKAFLNHKRINFNYSSNGKNGWATIPYEASSGKIVLIKSKGSQRQVAKTSSFRVIPFPKITSPSRKIGVYPGREFSVRGFDLNSPGDVSGLSYSWKLTIPDNKYSLQLIRKHSREAVLKIVAHQTLPDHYFDQNQHRNGIALVATANGEQKELRHFNIYLKR